MKTKKWFYTLLVAVVAMFGIAIISACGETKTPIVEGAETGVYYYDAAYDEYLITLNSGDKVSFAVNGANKSGTYALDGEKLTFTFYGEGEESLTAAYSNEAIMLTYDGAQMCFLKKINYTVTFETNGGSEISAATVVNGKTVIKPEDPALAGKVFLGWFADGDFKTPYDFANNKITQDVTVFAKWGETGQSVVGKSEFEISFDYNYAQAQNPESVKTVGGKLYSLPQTPEREGYTFCGWWISMSGIKEELTYQYTSEVVFDESTTLFALWRSAETSGKLPAPLVSVSYNKIEWDGNANARGYLLDVKDVRGVTLLSKEVTATEYNYDFSAQSAGDYTVTVTAIANAGASNNSDPAVRVYKNKALARVSLFEVAEPSMLIFNRVENAQEYYVTLLCGNPDHVHDEVYNAGSTVFSFANCDMREGGLQFVVRAHADGYADSVSQSFAFSRDLQEISQIVFDEANETFVWDSVPYAAEYIVTVKSGNLEDTFSVGTATSLCVKSYDPANGGLTISVVPKTTGYNSPAAATKTYNKATLASPSGLSVDGTKLVWDAVNGAGSYEVDLDGQKFTVNEGTEFDLADKTLLKGEYYSLYVRAIPAAGTSYKSSLWSDALDIRNAAMAATLKFENGVLSWAHVLGADGYTVTVNGTAVEVDTNSYQAQGLKAGENVFTVKFNDAADTSETVELKVFLYTVVVNDDGKVTTYYKLAGDKMDLVHGDKNGYTFKNWYTVSGGADANGAKYDDTLFGGNGDLYLYAYYAPNTYKVNLWLYEGKLLSTVEVKYQRPFTLPVPDSDDPDKAFGCWNGLPDGSGIDLTDSFGKGGNWPWAEDRDVYVFWEDLLLKYAEIEKDGVVRGYSVSYGAEKIAPAVINIPQSYKGKPVLEIADYAFDNTWCESITQINIPQTIELIGLVTPFGRCVNLTAVNIYKVEGAKQVRYASEDGVLFDYGKVDDQTAGQLATIIFVPLNKTGEYVIPNYVGTIQSTVFANSKISEIVIPTSVTSIGNSAFENCVYLSKVTFENPTAKQPALTIANRAFKDCVSLTKITLPARVGELPLTRFKYSSKDSSVTGQPTSSLNADQDALNIITDMFYGCTSLIAVDIESGNNLYTSDSGVLYNAAGNTLLYYPVAKSGAFVIPQGVYTVANGAFFECTALTALTVHGYVTSLGECSFFANTQLVSVTVQGSLSGTGLAIGKNAFRDCVNLSELKFVAGDADSIVNVKTIGEGAFMNCDSLVAVELPNTVTNIKDGAFRGCDNLKTLGVADNTSTGAQLTYGDNTFTDCTSLQQVYIPQQAVNFPRYTGCPHTLVTQISANNKHLSSEGGANFNADKTELLKYTSSETTFIIPSTVIKIADEAFRGTNIQEVVIPDSVAEIGARAFENCEHLEKVTFTGGNQTDLIIGDSAFNQCVSLSEIEIPARTTEIGANAFNSLMDYYGWLLLPDTALSSLTFAPNSRLEKIGNAAFDGTFITSVVIPKSVKLIGDAAFRNTRLEKVEFEANGLLEEIGSYAFSMTAMDTETWEDAVSRLISVINIPKTVKYIRPQAFANCANLETVTFEGGGTSDLILGEPVNADQYEIMDYYTNDYDYEVLGMYFGQVFANCVKLSEISLPARTVQLGYYTFGGCEALKSVSFKVSGDTGDSRLAFIDIRTFMGSGIQSIVIPKSVSSDTENYEAAIRVSAFENCAQLVTVTFEEGDNPVAIGDYAFKGCASLKTISLPATLASIYYYDWEYIPALAKDDDGDTARINVFDGCSSLTEISIGAANEKYASEDGVLYTKDLKIMVKCPAGKTGKLELIASLEKIANGALDGCKDVKTLYIPASFNNLNKGVLNSFTGLTSIEIDANNKTYSAEGLVVYSADKTKLLFALVTGVSGTYAVLDGTTEIADGAFSGCKDLTGVELPESLRIIGAEAFMGSSITQIRVPASVEKLGGGVFMNCYYLETLTFANGCAVTELPENAFTNCEKLTSIRIPANVTALPAVFNGCDKLETVTFEAGSVCASIADSCFEEAYASWEPHHLKTVELPASLTSIGKNAFKYCSNLTSVGTIPSGVKVLSGAFYGCSKLSVVNLSEGLVEIGADTFHDCGALTSLIIPSTVTNIGDNAFMECKAIKFTFEDINAITYLGESAFQNCDEITSFAIPTGVTVIPKWLFYGCDKLESVTMHEGITSIAIGAFQSCVSLKEIVIPSLVQKIDENVFANCTSLETVTLGKGVSAIAGNAFNNCKSLKAFVVVPENSTYASRDGILYSKDYSTVILVPAGKSDT